MTTIADLTPPEPTFADTAHNVSAQMDKIANATQPAAASMSEYGALQVMLAAAATEGATEHTVLDALTPYLPYGTDTLRLRSLSRQLIKDAAAARVRAEHTSQLIAAALTGYPTNLGPAPLIVDAAPFIGRPSVFTRQDVA
jgi:hypothetical protein